VVVCVLGASGDLGVRVLAALRARGVEHRALARRGNATFADLGDPGSLDAAFTGGTRLFLVSSPVPEQVRLETNAIEAAERTGLERIVKVSNIPIPGLDRGVHGNHRAIERRLDASPVASTVLQPSFFTTVIDRQRALIARGRVVLPFGAGRIAWVDPDDIAEVAAVALTRDVDAPIRITGPEALDADEVAARLGVRRLDPPLPAWREAVVADGLDPWLADSTVELYAAVARGALAEVTPDVERVLGRPPKRVFVVQSSQESAQESSQ
jgi:(4-alkanoyl-5-oxo-2,5-dihydrofuran-3-yl)methyl phosphate reductase